MSKTIIQPTKSGSPSSRKSQAKQRITKRGTVTIKTQRGTTRSVKVYPGDILVTTTDRNGKTYQTVIHKDVSRDYSVSSNKKQYTKKQQSKTYKENNQTNEVENTSPEQGNSSNTATASVPRNDLSFISQYVQAYKSGDWDKVDAFNRALSKMPNKNTLWHGIWRGIDSNHTQELSDAQHEMLYTIHPGTKDEMGQMNWYNIFNGNLLQATAPNSLDYVSPEQRAKTIQISTPNYSGSFVNNSGTVEDIIRQNPDMFQYQYEYAKQNNSFDYRPSVFNAEKLNVKQKYGGIGDFMDTYGLSPQYLFETLDGIFNPKFQNGGNINRKSTQKPKEKTDAVDVVTGDVKNKINRMKKDTPQRREQLANQAFWDHMYKYSLNSSANELRSMSNPYYNKPITLQKIKDDLINLGKYFFGVE